MLPLCIQTCFCTSARWDKLNEQSRRRLLQLLLELEGLGFRYRQRNVEGVHKRRCSLQISQSTVVLGVVPQLLLVLPY
jgi:hypothetical protein